MKIRFIDDQDTTVSENDLSYVPDVGERVVFFARDDKRIGYEVVKRIYTPALSGDPGKPAQDVIVQVK